MSTPIWLGSPNFSPNRDGHSMAIAPAWIVIHTMVGTVAAANGVFQNNSVPLALRKSAHYGVGSDGKVVQWVKESDAAWHAGDYDINLDSIGIEHADGGDYNGVRPDALYAASAILVREICGRYGIPIQHGSVSAGVSGIVPHYECTISTCPDALDWRRIIREASAPPSPTFTEFEAMKFETWHGGAHFFALNDAGDLRHRWKAGATWMPAELIGEGHRYLDGVETYIEDGVLLHVVARRQDGTIADYTQAASGAGSGTWVSATL